MAELRAQAADELGEGASGYSIWLQAHHAMLDRIRSYCAERQQHICIEGVYAQGSRSLCDVIQLARDLGAEISMLRMKASVDTCIQRIDADYAVDGDLKRCEGRKATLFAVVKGGNMSEDTNVLLASLGLLIEDFGEGVQAIVEDGNIIVTVTLSDNEFASVYENLNEHPSFAYATEGETDGESKFVFESAAW